MFTIERQWKVCRENGWQENKPSEWHPAGTGRKYKTKAMATEMMEVLQTFNDCHRATNMAKYRINSAA